MSNQIETFGLHIYNQIINLIDTAKQKVVSYVNSEMTMLYWDIGKTIRIEVLDNERAEYGEQIIEYLSKELTLNYGRGFSRPNIFRMIQFYDCFSSFEIVSTLSRQLSWSHILEIIKVKDELKRQFYVQVCINERWSVRALKNRIDSMLFERTAISKRPDETIKNDLELLDTENKMTTDLFFRDPYVLDFLNLKDTYSEKDLENAILAELEKFILEMGSDFAFMARQKRITIGNTDYYIDLLFFHRKMKRLVAIELKLGEFKPVDKGQVELYLRWLEKHEMQDGEDTPLGLILCAEKDEETVELLQLDKSGIHVGQYFTQLPPKEVFEKKLIEAIGKVRMNLNELIEQ